MDDIDKKTDMMIETGLIYLNHASVGPLPRKSMEVYNREISVHATIGERKINYDAIEHLWESLRRNIATLLKGDKEGVTITTNTASGLHIVADGLFSKYKAGQKILLPDIEFVTNSYCWQIVAKRYQLELELVPSEQGEIQLETWEKFIDDKTTLVALSHVQFSSGFRSDLKAISSIAHDHGAYVSVDAIQSLGIVPFDVKRNNVDFVSAAGYKWLLGPYGTGLFYCKPELVDMLDSILVGWFSTPNYKELRHQTFQPWSDARKFQQSMINPAMNAFNASLEVILDWGEKNSYKKVIKLLDFLIAELNQLDQVTFDTQSSLSPQNRSGILKITSSRNMQSLVSYLGKQMITVAYRDEGMRVSPHAYNTKDDILSLVDHIKKWNDL